MTNNSEVTRSLTWYKKFVYQSKTKIQGTIRIRKELKHSLLWLGVSPVTRIPVCSSLILGVKFEPRPPGVSEVGDEDIDSTKDIHDPVEENPFF